MTLPALARLSVGFTALVAGLAALTIIIGAFA